MCCVGFNQLRAELGPVFVGVGFRGLCPPRCAPVACFPCTFEFSAVFLFPASRLLCVGLYVLWLLQLGHGYCLEVWLLFFLLDEHSLFQSSSCKLWICSRRMSLNFWAQLLRTAHSCNNSAFPKIYESLSKKPFSNVPRCKKSASHHPSSVAGCMDSLTTGESGKRSGFDLQCAVDLGKMSQPLTKQ